MYNVQFMVPKACCGTQKENVSAHLPPRYVPVGTKRYRYISRKAATSHLGKIVSPEREKTRRKGCNTHQYYLTFLPLYLHENDTSYIVREELAIKKDSHPTTLTHTHTHSYTYTHTHTPFALGVHHYMPQIGN